MADSPMPPAPSKALVLAWRSASTLLLWTMVAWVFMSRASWAFLILIGVLVIVATVEYFRMLRAAGVGCFPRFGILLATGYCGTLYAAMLNGRLPSTDLDALAIFIALAGSFGLQLRQPIRSGEALLAVAASVFGFIYIAFFFNFAARLLFLVPGPDPTPGVVGDHSAYLLLWLVVVTKVTDMGAYITGSRLGRHKMIPHVSPGKTWEGLGGALLFPQLAGCGLYAACPELSVLHSWGHVIALGFLLSILAVIGDLAESVLKRALDTKDSGRMLPGIGGALDLIDSLCFTAPALYFYLIWILLPAA